MKKWSREQRKKTEEKIVSEKPGDAASVCCSLNTATLKICSPKHIFSEQDQRLQAVFLGGRLYR